MTFIGELHSIEGDEAAITLWSNQGRVYDGIVSSYKMQGNDIRPGERFECKVEEDGNAFHIVSYKRINRKRMSDEEWQKLVQETHDAIGETE
jgi:hypothetical protein